MVDFILEIDWMSTKEFCDFYKLPHPYFTGDVSTSAALILQVDAIKHRMFVEHAKLLNKNITAELLVTNLGFKNLDVRDGNPCYQFEKYKITNDEYGFWLEPYDSVDGRRIHKLSDLTSLDLTYTG